MEYRCLSTVPAKTVDLDAATPRMERGTDLWNRADHNFEFETRGSGLEEGAGRPVMQCVWLEGIKIATAMFRCSLRAS